MVELFALVVAAGVATAAAAAPADSGAPADSRATAPGATPSWTTQGPMRVGEEVEVRYETPHPYGAFESDRHRLVHRTEIHLPGATYVTPFFSRFELAPGDYVVVRQPDGARRWRYERFGKGDLGRGEGFWGIHVPGETAWVDLYSRGSAGAWGYRIDKAARGFRPVTQKAICGLDDKESARCYEAAEPSIYAQSRAVARLWIQGTALCTGWLVGSEGHLLTNNHCIDSEAAAMNTDYELLAEGSCGQSCGTLACDGTVVATSGTLIAASPAGELDYSLVYLLPSQPLDGYGYFRLRAGPPVLGERLFIPQHPGGRGKEIAVVSTEADSGGFVRVEGLSVVNFVSYFGDTEGGSSGSPVVAHGDGCVVALHSGAIDCDQFGNVGARSDLIVQHLGALAPADSVVEEGLCAADGDVIFAEGFESGDTSGWSATVN